MKSHLWKPSTLALALLLGLVAPSTSAFGATHSVDIKNFAFVPKDLTISVGDTVTWTQRDSIQHTSTSDAVPRLWDSGLLSVGQTFSHTFTTAGTFPYHCTPHAGTMKATITVQAPVNTPPTVSLSEPAAGAVFPAPATVTLTAAATDSDGTVSSVEFLNGTNSVGVVTTSPFSLTLTNLPPGSYTFTARATDNAGATTESAPVSVTVSGVVHNVDIKNFAFVPKDLTINVGDTVVWTQHDAIQHTSTSDAVPRLWDSGLLSVGQTFSHTFTTAGTFPYHCTPHAGTMKATITVQAAANVPPTVSLTGPAPGSMFTAPATVVLTAVAADSDGTVSSVEFLSGTNSLGVVTASPFTLTLTNLAFGIYTLTAKATDNLGATTVSDAVVIMVNNPPTVSLGAPGKGAVFLSPATFTLAANAADADGTIVHVEFYDGTNSLGVVTNSPFNLTWTNVPSGSHVITVEAVDDMGAETTSAPVVITVSGAASYTVQNLVSDLPGLASHTDTNLVNPWGIAFSATGPFWVSDNHSGRSTLYVTDGTPQALIVAIPAPGAPGSPGAPTGQIFNGTTNFALPGGAASRFVFSTEDGTIVAWSAGTNSVIVVDNSTANANYKGLAIGASGGSNYLYATDFHNSRIDVFDGSFHAATLDGGFADPNLPAGFAPFGIQNIGGNLYVTYAMPDAEGHDDVPGAGHGFVNVFDTSGHLVKRFASGGVLNSPWGVAMAPAGFGELDGRILVGNFGDGWINAFDATTGAFVGYMETTNSSPIVIEGLWDLKFGNNGRGGDGNRLYFTAGISGGAGIEDHGLFGSISAVSAIEITSIVDQGLAVTLSWAGGTPPYLLQAKTSVSDTSWFNVLTTSESSATVPKVGGGAFFRVMDQATNTVRPFSARLAGDGETPAIDTAGVGLGMLSIEGDKLSYVISFSGLSSASSAAHIHGLADATHSTGVLFGLNGALGGTSGILAGTQTLTPDQMTGILTGMTYVNVHTSTHGGGEIRGQVVPLRIPVTLSGAAEVPPVDTAGVGAGAITLIGTQMTYEIHYSGLSADAAAAHVHGPADAAHPANVLFGLEGVGGSSGTLAGSHTLSLVELGYLLAGQTYVNIHTSIHSGGEVRGQIVLP